MAYRLLPVSDLPNVDFPTIQVSASLPGASPETMASAVATAPGEAVLHHRRHRLHDSSTASAARQITLQFDLDRDIDAAAQDVQAAIAATQRQLPARHAEPAVLPEGQPGGLAHPLPGADLADPAACPP